MAAESRATRISAACGRYRLYFSVPLPLQRNGRKGEPGIVNLKKRQMPELQRIITIVPVVGAIFMIACLAGCSTASVPPPPAQPALSPPVAPSGEHPAGNGSEAIETIHGKIASVDPEPHNGIHFEGGGAAAFNANLNGRLIVKIGSPRNGNLVLVWLLVGSAAPTLSPPSGYAQVGSTWTFNIGNTAAALFYHFWNTGDPTTLTLNVGTNSAHCEWAYANYSGVNTSTPFDGRPREATKNHSKTGSSPSITPGAGNDADMLLMLYGEATAGRGYVGSSSLGTIRSQHSYEHVAVWVDARLSSSSATGAQTVGSNLLGNWIGVQALLLPQSRGRSVGGGGGDRD